LFAGEHLNDIDVAAMVAGEQPCHIDVAATARRRTTLPHRCCGDG